MSRQPTTVTTVAEGVARISWLPDVHAAGLGAAVDGFAPEIVSFSPVAHNAPFHFAFRHTDFDADMVFRQQRFRLLFVQKTAQRSLGGQQNGFHPAAAKGGFLRRFFFFSAGRRRRKLHPGLSRSRESRYRDSGGERAG